MYFTDRGIEELQKRRGEEEISVDWLAERLREFETPIERLASWMARLDDDDDE